MIATLHELVMAAVHWHLARHCGAPAKVDLVPASGKTCTLVPTRPTDWQFVSERGGAEQIQEKKRWRPWLCQVVWIWPECCASALYSGWCLSTNKVQPFSPRCNIFKISGGSNFHLIFQHIRVKNGCALSRPPTTLSHMGGLSTAIFTSIRLVVSSVLATSSWKVRTKWTVNCHLVTMRRKKQKYADNPGRVLI